MFYSISKYFLTAILLVSGIFKILSPNALIEVLKTISVFPSVLIVPTITLLPIFEILLAVTLFFNIKVHVTLLLNNGLFLFFFLFSIYGTLIGLDQECGCFGNLIKSYFDWKMILRNFIFLALSTYLTYNNFKSSKQHANRETN